MHFVVSDAMPYRRSLADKQRYFTLVGQGMTQREAARTIGINTQTARAWEKGVKNTAGVSIRESRSLAKIRAPIHLNVVRPDAKKALDDFGYFRRRYFGRIASPWQEDAAYKFDQYLWSPQKEFIVLNCPPGAGKSTLMHDIEVWLTVRNRSIRGILGSATQRMAVSYSMRLRRTFERRIPLQGDPIEVAAGREMDAEATLVGDFGRFQPDNHDLWRAESFVIAQHGDVAIEEKEPTWQAFGLDTGYLGTRVNAAIWDDVVTKKSIRTMESLEKQRDQWDDEAETRLEPDGALFLVGQRLGSNDLYRYCVDKPAGVDHDDDDDPIEEQHFIEPEGSQTPRKYHHLVYPAHDESRCIEQHGRSTAKAWPEGCLLDPIRLPWRELSALKRHKSEKFDVVYQQKDVDSDHVLVPRVWITGGTDPNTGEVFPGCYDNDRGLGEIPKLEGETYSIVTADPSPTNFWSIQWWIYHPASEFRFLIDHDRRKMEAPDFLDWNYRENEFYGLAEDWVRRAKKLGKPIQYFIIEKNAAQRFLMQFDHFRRWQVLHGMSVYGHETTSNKTDDDFGVQTIAPHYRYGRIRLPNKSHGDMGFVASRWLVDEVTTWPSGQTDDCVMAHWFLEWWIPRVVMPDVSDIPRRPVPSWMRNAS
jgi:hypothetical protein